MKKTLVLSILLLTLFVLPKIAFGYQQTEAICYSQCAAYKFVWKGDFCWDLFTNQCSISGKDALKNTIKLLKDTVQAIATGKLMTLVDISMVYKAMFICKPLIEDCIVPQLEDCANTCKNISQTFYAPNLSVGNPYGSISYQNVYYDDVNHQLTFKVTNSGGYAWDIDVSASWGHTRNRDKIVNDDVTLFTEKIPELLLFGARVGSPKTPGDYVTDFLIDQSNFSGFLKKYKSDADNHYVPPAWYKTIPFTAPEGEYTRVIFKVDPNQVIPERSESDNTYILDIDKLPTPFSLSVENFTFRRTNPTSLTEHMVSFELKNSGEESGNANVKWYEGNYEPGKKPIKEQSMIVQGLNKASFDDFLNVDVTKGGDSCNHSQKYTLVVFDDDGFIKTRREFFIPLYAGTISGRVEDLFGKKVVGATITTNTGQTATVNESGYYRIGGISTLGKITITATHPEFSKTETKEVEIKFDDSKDKCAVEGLTHTGINFILKDLDVMFNVLVKDSSGNFVRAHVLASNKNWRFEQNVNGQTPLLGMQPGEYVFTISAAGYKTISQTINAVPNDQNLEFVLEKLNGRLTDGGLTIHQPQLLWQMERGEEILSQVAATKDGSQIILYTTRNRANTGKLYFLNLETGSQNKVVSSTLATVGQPQACLDTSYDGKTTALYVHDGVSGIAQKTRNVIKLFNKQGNEFGTTDFQSGGGVQSCDVSPDGFYIYPDRLINKGLYVYTRQDIFGIKDDEEHAGYVANDTLHFTTSNNIVAGCPEGGGQCVQTINKTLLTTLFAPGTSVRDIDSNQDGSKIGLAAIEKVYLFSGATKNWEKNIKIYGDLADISISPGGKFVIYSTASEMEPYRSIKIFTDNNIDKTPSQSQKGKTEDVVFVHANDKGIYYLVNDHRTLKFYKVGSYSVDYNPPTTVPTTTETATSGLSYYSNGYFYPAGIQRFDQLVEGLIYMANRTINFDMGGGKGGLNILDGTIFSVDHYRNPILLKGQMTADFSSPAIIYAIKFDRFNMDLFRTKLDLFRSNKLPESEYFVVKNIHTKFTIKNGPNNFNVAVESGTVNVLANKTEKIINSGRQITVDAKNNIKESIYLSSKLIVIITTILLFIAGAFLFYYRKTKIGAKIIVILKATVMFTWKYFKIFLAWFCKTIRKLALILWRWLKSALQFLIKTIGNLFKKKK